VPDISQNANPSLHSQLKDWKYVRLVRKWGHYSHKMKKGEKDVGWENGRQGPALQQGSGLLVRFADD